MDVSVQDLKPQFANSTNADILCDQCSKSGFVVNAARSCQTCRNYLCLECVSEHKNAPTTKAHEIRKEDGLPASRPCSAYVEHDDIHTETQIETISEDNTILGADVPTTGSSSPGVEHTQLQESKDNETFLGAEMEARKPSIADVEIDVIHTDTQIETISEDNNILGADVPTTRPSSPGVEHTELQESKDDETFLGAEMGARKPSLADVEIDDIHTDTQIETISKDNNIPGEAVPATRPSSPGVEHTQLQESKDNETLLRAEMGARKPSLADVEHCTVPERRLLVCCPDDNTFCTLQLMKKIIPITLVLCILASILIFLMSIAISSS